MYVDKVKTTIMKMIKDKVNLQVVDSPINQTPIPDNENITELFFKSYEKGSLVNFNVIDHNSYWMYDKEVIPQLGDIVGLSVYNTSNRLSSKIIGYDNGLMLTEVGVGANLYSYNDKLIITQGEEVVDQSDYIMVSSIYNFNKTLTGSVVEEYRRFDIVLFTYDDLNANKSNYLMRQLQSLFNRDFMVLDEKGNKTRECAYVSSQLKFNIGEYNITNRVIRGSMLIKSYTK